MSVCPQVYKSKQKQPWVCLPTESAEVTENGSTLSMSKEEPEEEPDISNVPVRIYVQDDWLG